MTSSAADQANFKVANSSSLVFSKDEPLQISNDRYSDTELKFQTSLESFFYLNREFDFANLLSEPSGQKSPLEVFYSL